VSFYITHLHWCGDLQANGATLFPKVSFCNDLTTTFTVSVAVVQFDGLTLLLAFVSDSRWYRCVPLGLFAAMVTFPSATKIGPVVIGVTFVFCWWHRLRCPYHFLAAGVCKPMGYGPKVSSTASWI
jgi:hypothetical protein